MAELETYIPLPQAAVQFGLAEKALRRMVENGLIRAIQLPDGEVAVNQQETDGALSREEQADRLARELRARYAHLRGKRISLSQAERKYEVPNPTLSRWADRGIITTLARGRNRTRLLDEADVAYAVEVYRMRQASGPTSRVFDEQGRPYVLKRPALARKRKREKQDPN